jgi:putative two-component system response regulator
MSGTRILVVDDDKLQRKYVGKILVNEFKCEVVEAGDIKTGFELAQQQHPSIALIDYFLPDGNGIELIKKFRSDDLLRPIVVFVVTSSDDVSILKEALAVGADDFLHKPVIREELFARIRSTLKMQKIYTDLEESFLGSVNLIAEFIGLRVPNSSVRAQRSVQLGRWLAKRLGMDYVDRQTLEFATRIREIGKTNFPDDIISKEPHVYTMEDEKQLQHSALLGEKIVLNIPKLNNVAAAVRHQFENFDGSGYPDRLFGDEIPIMARILRIFNVMDHTRNVRITSFKDIAANLQSARGTLVDPKLSLLAEEFLTSVDDTEWTRGKRQVRVNELKPGMKLAIDLFTGSGEKLLAKDAVITNAALERIKNFHRSDPIISSIFVFEQDF